MRVIHRDIRADTVYIDNDDNAVLGNFALATAINTRMKSLAAHTKAGCQRHMAPEVIYEEDYNYQADVWSFGVLLCQMATNKLPFRNDHDACAGTYVHEIVSEITDNKIK